MFVRETPFAKRAASTLFTTFRLFAGGRGEGATLRESRRNNMYRGKEKRAAEHNDSNASAEKHLIALVDATASVKFTFPARPSAFFRRGEATDAISSCRVVRNLLFRFCMQRLWPRFQATPRFTGLYFTRLSLSLSLSRQVVQLSFPAICALL